MKTAETVSTPQQPARYRRSFIPQIVPGSYSRVLTGPARQMWIPLCWVPLEKGTILYACLQEWPIHPFEKQLLSELLVGETGVNELDCE